jgi:carbon monoxide dehydrogenase subunit G
MIIEGDFTINAPVEQAWNFLVDVERMSVCMPGVEKVERTGADTYTGMVTVKVGPIATSFQGEVKIIEQKPPEFLKAGLQGRDRKTASMVTGEFSSEISSLEENLTRVGYTFDIKIRGRLGQFGQAVIQDTSRQLTNEFVKCVRARIEYPDNRGVASPPDSSVGAIAFRAFFSNLWAGLRKAFGFRE